MGWVLAWPAAKSGLRVGRKGSRQFHRGRLSITKPKNPQGLAPLELSGCYLELVAITPSTSSLMPRLLSALCSSDFQDF